MKKYQIISILSLIFTLNIFGQSSIKYHIVDLKVQRLRFYLKDDYGRNFQNFENLSNYLRSKKEQLVFAMNGGMYKKDLSPQGLYIEKTKKISPLDTVQHAYGNFYLQPNGVFYITSDNKAKVVATDKFVNENVQYGTQSGPMLVIDGQIHSKFREHSKNINIRNGVGVLPNGKIIFAISKTKINLYNFANFFKSKGCKNALYLDGFVSKAYFPNQENKDDKSKFGVIIAEIM